MDAVVMQFPNSIDTVRADGIKKTVLLSTSNTSRIIGSPAIVTVEVLKQIDNANLWKQKNIPMAVLLEGHFKSLYAHFMCCFILIFIVIIIFQDSQIIFLLTSFSFVSKESHDHDDFFSSFFYITYV